MMNLHQILRCRLRLAHIEIDCSRLIDKQLNLLWPSLLWSLELDRMDFNHLIEGDRQNQLFIAVRLQRLVWCTAQTVLHRMVIGLVQTLAFRLRHKNVQIHHTRTVVFARVAISVATADMLLNFCL